MCYQKFHLCKYCFTEYPCSKQNWVCSTLANDRDANMCESCRNKLEEFLLENEPDEMQLEDLIGQWVNEDE